jgi:hypothetical protein
VAQRPGSSRLRPPTSPRCCGHPAVLATRPRLTLKLCQAPPAVHAAAARSCVRQGADGPTLLIDFGDDVLQHHCVADDLARHAAAAVRALAPQPQVTLRLHGIASHTFDFALAAAEGFLHAAGTAAQAALHITGIPDVNDPAAGRCALVRTTEQRDRLNALLRSCSSRLHSLQGEALNHRGPRALRDEEQDDATFTFSGMLPSLAELTALRDLHITCCVIEGAAQTSAFLAALAQLSGLTELELNANRLSGGSLVVLGALAELPELAALALLDNNCRGDQAVVQIAAAPALTRLTLAGDEFSGRAQDDIMHSVAECAELRQLSLLDVGQSTDVLALSQACSALHKLQGFAFLGYDWPDPPITDVLQALPAPEQLTCLELAAMWDDPEDAAGVLGALGRRTRMHSLELYLGGFKGDTPRNIWQALPLSELRGLQLLSINQLIAGKAGAEALAAARPHLTALTCLRLPGTRCAASQDAGTWSQAVDCASPVRCESALLARTLRALPALAELDLSLNALGDEGLRAIASALSQLARLTALVLDKNGLSSAGALVVAQAATALPKLARLQAAGNAFDSKVAQLLRKRLLCVPTLHDVCVQYQS